MSDPLGRISELGVLPLVEVTDAESAAPVAHALLQGGLPVMEIAFRTDAAASAIALVHERWPEVLVGAGTVLTIDQADAAIRAGAAFVVSPGHDPAVTRHVMGRGTPMIPGVCTPSEVQAVMAEGISIMKFFPSEAAGGISFLRALAGPFPTARFVPTGGIGLHNLADYLALTNVCACGGSWMAKPASIVAGDYDLIAAAASEARSLAWATGQRVRGMAAQRA